MNMLKQEGEEKKDSNPMKVFKRDRTKKYVCEICSHQFNWNKNSFWFGKRDSEPEFVVCSEKCKKKIK